MIPFLQSVLIVHLAALLCASELHTTKRPNGNLPAEHLSEQGNDTVQRRFPFTWRRTHFPIIPPRLRIKVSSTTTESTTIETSTLPSDRQKQVDIFEISSSDNSPAVVWPFPRKPVSRRFRTPSFTTSAPRVLPKLLQPKPTRPAIYSLDGFVPKPSIERISTTDAPLEIRRAYNQLLNESRKKKGHHKGRQSLFEDDGEKEKYVLGKRKKPVSRYTAFARKGIPGLDYPVHVRIPATNFECGTRAGMYADPHTDCQVWHMCPGGTLVPRHSFLCPNGTIFNELRRICDWWYNVRCEKEDIDRKRRSVDVFKLEDPLPDSKSLP